MTPDIAKLAGRFQFEGEFVDAKAYGFGYINDTYAARASALAMGRCAVTLSSA